MAAGTSVLLLNVPARGVGLGWDGNESPVDTREQSKAPSDVRRGA